jgi:hypothetical protein
MIIYTIFGANFRVICVIILEGCGYSISEDSLLSEGSLIVN